MTKNAHSPGFIAEMKKRLHDEQQLVQQELAKIGTSDKSGVTAKFPDYGEAEDENAQEVADFQALEATAQAAQARLQEIEAALARIDAGVYGVTEEGEPIPEPRLRANPAATTLVHPNK